MIKCCPSCCGGCKIVLRLYICDTVLNRIVQTREWIDAHDGVMRAKKTGTAHEYLDLKCKTKRDLYFLCNKLQEEMIESEEADLFDVFVLRIMSRAETTSLLASR